MDYSVTSQMENNAHAKWIVEEEETPPQERPHFISMTPVFKGLHKRDDADDNTIVGFLLGVVPFDAFMGNLLPQGVTGVDVVIANSCDQKYTYTLVGPKVRGTL